MIKAHMKKDGSYDECHATKRACPLGGSEVHREFKSLNEMNDYNEKLAERGSNGRKLSKAGNDKIKKIDSIIEQTQLDIDALERVRQLQANTARQLDEDNYEFDYRACNIISDAFEELEPSMESAYKAADEVYAHLKSIRSKLLPITINRISHGMRMLAPHGLKMSDFLDEDSIRSIQMNGSESAVNALDKKRPYGKIKLTHDGDDIRVEASSLDSNGRPFTVSGIVPPEKYVDGVGRNFYSTNNDYEFIFNKGISTDEFDWPDGIRNRIDYASDVIKRNGLTDIDFASIIMNNGHDSNRLIADESELEKRKEEASKNDVRSELARLECLNTAAMRVKEGSAKDIFTAIKDINSNRPIWISKIFRTDKSEDYDNPSIGNWLSDHGVDE